MSLYVIKVESQGNSRPNAKPEPSSDRGYISDLSIRGGFDLLSARAASVPKLHMSLTSSPKNADRYSLFAAWRRVVLLNAVAALAPAEEGTFFLIPTNNKYGFRVVPAPQ